MTTKKFVSKKDRINVVYKSSFIDKELSDQYFQILDTIVEYNSDEQSQVVVCGKKVSIPRKQVAYGDPGTYYKFSGTKVVAKSWSGEDQISKMLQHFFNMLEEFSGQQFNFVLINRYADGKDCIGYHRDDEKDLGDNPTIAGVSFGAQREIYFKPHQFIPHRINDPLKLNLEHGSVFLMKDPTNKHWKHSIPRKANVHSPRISLTFRHLVI